MDEGMEGGRQDVSWSERGRRVSVPVPQRGHVAWRGGLPLGGRSAAGAVGRGGGPLRSGARSASRTRQRSRSAARRALARNP